MTPQTIFSFFFQIITHFLVRRMFFSDLLKLIAILERCFLVMCPFNKMLDGPWQIAAAMLAPNHLQGEKMCVCFKKYFNQSLVLKKFLPNIKNLQSAVICPQSENQPWQPGAWESRNLTKFMKKRNFRNAIFLKHLVLSFPSGMCAKRKFVKRKIFQRREFNKNNGSLPFNTIISIHFHGIEFNLCVNTIHQRGRLCV